ncbi:MAG TPA: hypothetical protein VF188_07150 [Longimicrobiales bacterium]
MRVVHRGRGEVPGRLRRQARARAGAGAREGNARIISLARARRLCSVRGGGG